MTDQPQTPIKPCRWSRISEMSFAFCEEHGDYHRTFLTPPTVCDTARKLRKREAEAGYERRSKALPLLPVSETLIARFAPMSGEYTTDVSEADLRTMLHAIEYSAKHDAALRWDAVAKATLTDTAYRELVMALTIAEKSA